MHAKSSLRALLPFLFPFIHLSIAGVIPTSEDFFTTDSLLPSFDSNFNGGSNPKTAIALAPTTDPSQAASQVEFSNFGTDLFAESPSTIYDQEGQQGAASGQFVVPDTNTFPNLDQSSPNQLPASAPLNTVDTKPLPGPNTAVCKNPKETIPVCHNMHERTLLPPPLDIEMATTSTLPFPSPLSTFPGVPKRKREDC